ncbi:MAG: hypothetical protein BAJALOKI3v1_430012 [Promethearchaeota archaeon]|nr:MAG: hypothetical protein BAJALOKI3v1_430012 [Candidatus Lokiarchaeota archaeon]
MSENLINLLLGLMDGRVIHFILPNETSKPTIKELTPKTNNINTSALRIIKAADFYCIPSENGSVNIWTSNGEQLQKYKVLELKDKDEYRGHWEVLSIAADENYLYTGGPKGLIELWDIHNEFEKVDEFSVNNNPIRGLFVNDHMVFFGAGEANFKVLAKKERDEIYDESFPWAKYRIHNMIMNENFFCIALTGRVFSYTYNNQNLKVEKHAAFANTHNKVKGMCMYHNLCYSAAWDGKLLAWNILSKNPNPILGVQMGSLESVYVDDNFLYAGGHHGEFVILEKGKKVQVKDRHAFGSPIKTIRPYS